MSQNQKVDGSIVPNAAPGGNAPTEHDNPEGHAEHERPAHHGDAPEGTDGG